MAFLKHFLAFGALVLHSTNALALLPTSVTSSRDCDNVDNSMSQECLINAAIQAAQTECSTQECISNYVDTICDKLFYGQPAEIANCTHKSVYPLNPRMKRTPSPVISQTLKNWAGKVSGAFTGTSRDIKLIQAKNLPRVKAVALKGWHAKYTMFLTAKKESPPIWSRELLPWVQKVDDRSATPEVREQNKQDFARRYSLSSKESGALQGWGVTRYINEAVLKTAFPKLPDYTGLTLHIEKSDPGTINMLVRGLPGKRGTPGIYDVSDVIINHKSIANNYQSGEDNFRLRLIMTSRPGFTVSGSYSNKVASNQCAFIVNSRKGKYASPATLRRNEVDFMDGVSSRLQLLGYAVNKAKEPIAFYFDNVE